MGTKVIATNRKANHEYSISQTWEAGLVLMGTEVKSLRLAKVNLSDGWVDVDRGEVFLKEVHIGLYTHGNRENHAEKRSRKMLLNKREIRKLESLVSEKGFTLIPLKIYFKDRYAKLEFGLARGKKLHDKREAKKDHEAKREMDRAIKKKNFR